jgi:hypothetical protein
MAQDLEEFSLREHATLPPALSCNKITKRAWY